MIAARRAIRRARGWLRSLGPTVAVLLYHRIAVDPYDPFGLCIRPEHFEDQVASLKARYSLLSLEDLENGLSGELPKRAVLLTFDDGYFDLLACAAPILDARDVPAVAFITAAALGNPATFWWDELTESMLASRAPKTVKTRVAGTDAEWDLGDAPKRLEAYYDAHHRLRSVGSDERRRVLDDLRSQVTPQPDPPAERRPLSKSELGTLAAIDGIRIGAHTLSHPSLPLLAPEAQRREILEGKQRLEVLLGAGVDSFAYPHGDFSDTTAKLVRECDFRLAFTASLGVVKSGTDQFRLPRLAVPDCDGRTLCDHLDAWFAGNPRPWPT